MSEERVPAPESLSRPVTLSEVSRHISKLSDHLRLYRAEKRNLKTLFTDDNVEELDDTDELISAATKVRGLWNYCMEQELIDPAPTLLEKASMDMLLGIEEEGVKTPLPNPRKTTICTISQQYGEDTATVTEVLNSITIRLCYAIQEHG